MDTIKNILVPLDFSICSINALEKAIGLAERLKANLFIAHVYPVPAGGDATFFVESFMLDAIERRIRIEFKIVEHYNKPLKNLPVEYIVKMGFVVTDLLKIISEKDIHLVVMGTKGSNNMLEDFVGSTTSGLIEEAACPVLAIPEGSGFYPIRKIVFASDFEPADYGPAAETLKLFTSLFNAELHILKIKLGAEKIPEKQSVEAAKIHELLEDVPHDFQYESNSNVTEGINDYLNSNEVDLLALLPRRHNAFGKLFKEQITRQMALHSSVPILTLPD